jgi:alkylation response protein AidB-like acyl-CoA dehydrogenase
VTKPSSLDEIAAATAELTELRRSADEFLRRAWSVEHTRRLLGGIAPAFDRALWISVCDMGWADVLVGESSGGGGGSLRQLCVLTEAVGDATAPVPLAATAAARWCAQQCFDDIALLLDKPATQSSSGVSGRWPLVPYGDIATRMLVLAVDGDETVLGLVDAEHYKRESVRPLDHTPAARITMDDAPFQVIAAGAEAIARHQQSLFRMRLASTAELIGVAAAANQAAVEYAKVRVAFGRPIGAFQAVKHRLVDQRAAIEVGRALVNRAADACESDSAEGPALVSLAVFWAMDSLRAVPEGAIQVFGGIGYTWEHQAHVYLRRAASLAATLGSRQEHRDVVTAWLASRHRLQR